MQQNTKESINEGLLVMGTPVDDNHADRWGKQDEKLMRMASNLSETTEGGSIQKEIYIHPTFWNMVKLFFANTYEVTLICMGLALSIYDDDISSFLFQLVNLVLLSLSMKEMGKNTSFQRKISLFVMIFIVLTIVAKFFVIKELNPDITNTYSDYNSTLYSFGFEVIKNPEDGTITFDIQESITLEVIALLQMTFLYFYYTSRLPKEGIIQQTGYIYNSIWLNHYMKLYYTYFFLIALDTFFDHNLTQFAVLFVWSQRLYMLQLAMIALTQISYFIDPIKQRPEIYNILFATGLVLNNYDILSAGYHVITICAILGMGQLYEATYLNFLEYKKQKGDLLQGLGLRHLKTKLLPTSKVTEGEGKEEQQKDTPYLDKKGKKQNFASLNVRYYIDNYGPYIYIWVCRVLCIFMAYYYHNLPGFIYLSWVLLSFLISSSPFVNFTVAIFNPIFTFYFLYLYLVNIPGFIMGQKYETYDNPIYTTFYGTVFKLPTLESALYTTTMMFFILLIPTRYILKIQRDEFRLALFQKLSDKNSNFLWQLMFYVLKRMHILVLFLIFLFGMVEINIYIIGLLFFFIVYASSIKSYRQSGKILVGYASFFIWIAYLWSIMKQWFDSKGLIYNFLNMLTFTKVEISNQGVNALLEYNIPYWQWGILFLYVLMGTINHCFRRDKIIIKPDFDNEKEVKEYGSTAEYYEAKTDHVLRKKFPKSSKFLNRIFYICSEMMIIIILILQGFILAFQPPSVLFWGFLVFSLTLQRIVVSAGDEHPDLYRRCVRQSKALKIYAMFVIILQVGYHFVSDPQFLAKYGFGTLFTDLMGPFSKYLDFIGLQNLNGKDVAWKFMSQIAFYIMAVILEDYFMEQLRRKSLLSKEELGYEKEQMQHEDEQDQEELPKNQSIFVNDLQKIEEDDIDAQEGFYSLKNKKKIDRIEYQFEQNRYTIPFMVYKQMGLWRFFDEVAMNFHLITASVTVAFCLYFSISLFFSFYLICTVSLCIRAALALHREGKAHKSSIKHSQVDLNQAHQINKDYMHQASKVLLKVRSRQWVIQYWLLILSMIVMYPTPFFQRFKQRNPQYTEGINNTIFWMFWSGIYVSPEDLSHYGTYAPYYILIVALILEKYAQRWSKNRFNCTYEKVKEFKILEEKIDMIRRKQLPRKINKNPVKHSYDVDVKRYNDTQFVTIGEARHEIDRIESLYREDNEQREEARLKNILQVAIKRKYVTTFRNAMKIGMEQLSLFLLLLSAAYKSNLVSILYMFILFSFLMIKNKTTGMLIMTIAFGVILAAQYIAVLFNLTSMITPYEFPPEFNPYPNITGPYPQGQYIIPLYLKSKFLRENLIWTNFFGFDIERSTLDKIWFDFVNLALMTIYFFAYGNPINSGGIKVSFSATKSLEDALFEYSKIQIRKKAEIKIKHSDTIIERAEDDKEEDDYSEIAADNSHDYFLGATYYLNELKQNTALYLITKRSRFIFYIGWQIVTLLSIFVLAFLCKSFMSLGYMIACVPLMIYITDFFKQELLLQKQEKWIHPYYICGPILIFSFVDIAIQIFFQIPGVGAGTVQPNTITEWFGFERIWIINPNANYEQLQKNQANFFILNGNQLKFLILKCLNLFFIFLQNRIYESEAFHKFMKRDLRKLLTLANNYKKLSITYRFNNWKLQKVMTSQMNLKIMYEGVAELKYKMRIWQQLILGGLQQRNLLRKEKPDNQNLSISAGIQTPLLQEPEEQKDTQQLSRSQTAKKKVMFTSIKNTINSGLKISTEEVQKQYLERKKIFKEMRSKLPFFAKWYIDLHHSKVNPIFFQTEVEEASMTKKNMQKGQRKIPCELEVRMKDDINLYYDKKMYTQLIKKKKKKTGDKKDKSKKAEEEKQFTIENMPKTKEFLQPLNLLSSLLYTFALVIVSNFQFITYFLMIVSQIVTAGLITIIYPFAVFGYAIMEECRPGKRFWEFMIKYTIFILLMKFIWQLDFWLKFPDLPANYTAVNDWIILGLVRTDSTASLLGYILPEVLILFTIMGQQYYEFLTGLYEKRENEIENIQEARERYLKTISGKKELGMTFMNQFKEKTEQQEEEDDQGLTYKDRAKSFYSQLHQIKDVQSKKIVKDNYYIQLQDEYKQKEEFRSEYEDYHLERRYSNVDDRRERTETVSGIKKERKLKEKGLIKNYFSKSPYFKSLFPVVKEQKPGIDLYASITFIQFMVCIFLISFYTEIDTEGTQNLESSSQFSFHMVLVLFIQVAVMIVERYVNRTNPRYVEKKIGISKQEDEELNDDKILAKMNIQDTPRSMSVHVDLEKTRDDILNVRTDSKKGTIETPKIVLAKIRMTSQQLVKFFVQWILLIIYHVLIFWIYPINSNYVIYGTPYCQVDNPAFKNYGCLSFHQNIALKIFYIIFCIYFTLSALQIRFGLPDFRKGSSLLQYPTMGNKILYLIYYNLPFAMELKTMLDWCFTKTSLDMFEWLQLAQFHSEMYNAKVSGQNTYRKKFGSKINILEKCICGVICVGTVLFFLVGPFFMFSNLRFIASYNLVEDTNIQFGMQIVNKGNQESYQFPLFSSSHPLSIQSFTENDFLNHSYNNKPETKFFEFDQVQIIKIKNGSESQWQLSSDYRRQFEDLLEESKKGNQNVTITLTFTYAFTRAAPATALQAGNIITRVLNSNNTNDTMIIDQFYQTSQMFSSICDEDPDAIQDIYLDNFIATQVRLTEQPKAQPLPFPKKDMKLTYSCENFWAINVDDKGIVFITLSDLISAGFFSATSILGFYFGVALIVGQQFRSMFIYKGDRVFIVDSRDTGAILNLIECIFIARVEKNLKKEEELFHVLLEILRSPELLLHVTGTSLRAPL